MPFTPDLTERIARARADLRTGLPVVIDEGGPGQLVFAVETLTPARWAEILEAKAGPLVVALSDRRAETLRTPAYDGDLVRVAVPPGADLAWLVALADPARDLAVPLKGPFPTLRGEAAPGASAETARSALALIKSARLLPAALLMPRPDRAGPGQGGGGLTVLPREGLREALEAPVELQEVATARVPLAVSEAGRVRVFRASDGGEEHYAVEIGRPARGRPVLTRLHSACLTGDILGSLKCDCGPQLRAALEQMGAEGEGVLLYLNQEGRGIGLANKMRAYALQDQGFDTVEANHRLGFEDDERDFRIGAEILRRMGFRTIRLMTNNPRKVDMMRANGMEVVERVPLKVGETSHNRAYLATKARKSGHLL